MFLVIDKVWVKVYYVVLVFMENCSATPNLRVRLIRVLRENGSGVGGFREREGVWGDGLVPASPYSISLH